VETIPPEALKAPPSAPADSETAPESEPSEHPATDSREWKAAFQRFQTTEDDPRALDALWRGLRLPEVWRTLTVSDQVELGGEYNAAKKRLGVR